MTKENDEFRYGVLEDKRDNILFNRGEFETLELAEKKLDSIVSYSNIPSRNLLIVKRIK